MWRTAFGANGNVPYHTLRLGKLCMDDVWVFLPFILLDPHLCFVSAPVKSSVPSEQLTFLKVLRPARILPPVHVVYILSGGANILILISLTANRCTS